MSNRVINILVPVISIILGLLVGALVMLFSGYDPIAGYIALWNGIFGDSYAIGETITANQPIHSCGTGSCICIPYWLFNIGVEGQLIVGWFAAAYVGAAFELPMIHSFAIRITWQQL